MKSNFLVESIRGELQETQFYGWVTVVDKNQKILTSLDIPDYTCFMRSCSKPIQALCAIESNVIEKFNLDQGDIALCFSSHSGSKEHVERLKNILTKAGITEDAIQCGTHPPFDSDERTRLIREGLTPSALHNNCSAKHSYVILTCLAKGWDISTYKNFDHPVQKYINELMTLYCQPEKLFLAIDGCGMPVHGMTLTNMGAGFAKFFDGTTPGAEIIADAIAKYPHLAAGYGRIDTAIIRASEGKLISKTGAEGLIIITPRQSGKALVVKTACGNNFIRDYVAVEALRQLNWLNKPPDEDEYLSNFTKTNLYNHSKDKVGYYKFKFKL